MNAHIEQSPGLIPQAASDLTEAELPAAISSANAAGLRQGKSSVPTCHGRAFSHQDAIDYQEWVASGELR